MKRSYTAKRAPRIIAQVDQEDEADTNAKSLNKGETSSSTGNCTLKKSMPSLLPVFL